MVVAVYALFTASFFVHGLLIWDESVQRLASVGLGGVLVALTILVIRHGAFAPRATVELRVDGDPDEPGLMSVSVVDCGRVGTADVQLKYGLRRTVGVDVRAAVSRQLKVWVHGVTASGDSVGLPARVEIRDGGNSHLHDLSELTPQIVVALNGAAYHLSIEP